MYTSTLNMPYPGLTKSTTTFYALAVIVLSLSFLLRYRMIIFCNYYLTARSRPKHYAFVTALPYEAFILLALCIPRLHLIGSQLAMAILEHGALQNLGFSKASCWFAIVIITIDLLQWPISASNSIQKYMNDKQASLEPGLNEEKEHAKGVVETPHPPKGMWAKCEAYFFKPAPKGMAVQTIAAIHVQVFLKAMLLSSFTLNMTSQMSRVNNPARMLSKTCNIHVMFGSCLFLLARLVESSWRVWRFAGSEGKRWKSEQTSMRNFDGLSSA